MASALRYLARRDRTESQVRAFLVRSGVPAGRIPLLLNRLRELGYINDAAYAMRRAEARIIRRPMGRARLEAELIALGLDRSVVEETVEEVYLHRKESDLARKLIREWSRSRSAPGLVQQARRLRGRGFSEETIEEVLGS